MCGLQREQESGQPYSLCLGSELSACVTVLVGKMMFRACARRDLQHNGSTPAMFRVADPHIAGLLENMYRVRSAQKTRIEDGHHV